MKGKSVGKLLILSSLSIVALFSCNKDNNTVAETTPSRSKTCTIYDCNDKGKAVSTSIRMNLKFYSINNLPYVNVIEYLNNMVGTNVYTVTHKNDIFTFTNNYWKYKSSSYKPNAYFDMKTQSLKYDDYACFVNINPSSYHPVDLVAGKNVKIGYINYFGDPTGTYIAGDVITVKVKDFYNINSYVYQNNLYMPLYTVKTLFTSNHVPSVFFNGSAIYNQVPNYSVYPYYIGDIKEGLFTPDASYLEYNYNQLALELDLRYGMGGITRINRRSGTSGTTTYQAGLNNSCYNWLKNYKSSLTASYKSFDTQVQEIVKKELDDGGHTKMLSNSYMNTSKDNFDKGDESNYITQSYTNISTQRAIKKKGEDFIGYNSTTSTLILRGEYFLEDTLRSNLKKLSEKQESTYSECKNYLIDLSCNGGGYIYLQHAFNQFLSRGNSYEYFYCSTNGSRGSVKYPTDINIDGEINDKDYVHKDANIEIMCSNATFSAANATAFYAKKYPGAGTNVTILGERTGGGACPIDSTVMSPIGTGIQISCPFRICDSNYASDDDGVLPESDIWDTHSGTEATAKYVAYEDNLIILK